MYFTELHEMLHTTNPLGAIHAQDVSQKATSLAFRCITAAGGARHFALRMGTLQYPAPLFHTLSDPDLAEKLWSEPECKLDQFTKAIKATYRAMWY